MKFSLRDVVYHVSCPNPTFNDLRIITAINKGKRVHHYYVTISAAAFFGSINPKDYLSITNLTESSYVSALPIYPELFI